MKNKIEAIICDMDGTLVNYPNEPFHSSWDALKGALSEDLREKWKALSEFYYPKRELYNEWYKNEVALLRGIKVENVGEHLFPVPYSPGVKEFFANRDGYLRGIVSAGVGIVAERILDELGFDFSISNSIEVDAGKFTGEGESLINLWGKDLDILKIAERYHLNLKRVIYVGDNENDISAFGVVGVPVAFNPKNPQTEKAAKYVITHFKELNTILERFQT